MQNPISYKPLFSLIGFELDDPKLLKETFTHRSVLNERPNAIHNERLEFLGDAVLELATTEYLFEKYKLPEGVLTNYRSALVKRETLAQVAKKLELGKYLILSKGEENSGGREKEYLLANTVEALIGAIYLAGGMEQSRKFILDWILVKLDEIIKTKAYMDAKSRFQEEVQAEIGTTPHYEVVSEAGLDHDKTFIMGAFIDHKKVGEGEGGSKHAAQMKAAENALKNKKEWK